MIRVEFKVDLARLNADAARLRAAMLQIRRSVALGNDRADAHEAATRRVRSALLREVERAFRA